MNTLKKKILWFFGLFLLCGILTNHNNNLIANAATTSEGIEFEIEDSHAVITGYNGTATNIVIPEKLGGYNVTKIDDYAFFYCTALTKITIPSTVTTLGECVFFGCTGLISITLPDGITEIPDDTFFECTSLKSIKIPSKVDYIGKFAFKKCESLTSITIPSSVTSIGYGAFSYCNKLTQITIPSNVAYIDGDLFDGCENLTTINVASSNKMYSSKDGVLFNKDKTTLIRCPIGKTGTYTIPSSVTCIGYGAFYCCGKLTSITISNNVNEIKGDAFWGCNGITSINIPSSVSDIKRDSFNACDNLVNIVVDDMNKNYCSYDGLLYTKDKTKLLLCPGGKTGCIKPVKGTLYTDISAFYSSQDIEQVVLPEGMTTIDDSTFKWCENLKEIFIPSSVTEIGEGVFDLPETSQPVRIYCEEYSYAEIYAIINDLKYTTIQADKYLGNYTTSICQPSFTYTGNYIKPIVTVKGTFNGKTVELTNGKDYKVSYKNFKNPGTATITVMGIGEYVGTIKLNFTIKRFNISKLSTTINQSSFIYTGKYIKPNVVVKGTIGGKTVTLTNGEDYKVEYKNFKNPGIATITITGLNNYTGTVTKTFKILPNWVKSPKQVAGSTYTTTMKLTWTKCIGVTGYEVYRSTSKNGTYTKVKTVTSNTNYTTVTGLSAGIKYYYKIRAYKKVGTTIVYGAYSSILTTTTKAKAPTGLTLKVDTKKATISWSKATGAVGYEVYRSTSKNGTYSKVKETKSTTLTCTNKGLKTGKRYYYKVRAYTKTTDGTKMYSAFTSVKGVVVK